MQLWNEYEGVTIDGAYSLQKLLLPEGRSAFYSTTGPNGERKVVRLIECHFDEEDILARWQSVEALNHPNFLKFEHFGQTEIEGRPVVYAVFERVDANLAEVLESGTLPVEDVSQLGLSLVAALEVLHTHGFIHEHVEPRNIFALNDTVKLRGDCIREAPEGEQGRAAKEGDVRDLVNVLLQGLTQRGSIEGLPDALMPKAFRQIIRKGLDGTWGLGEIRAALESHADSSQAVAPASESVAEANVERGYPLAGAENPLYAEARIPQPRLREVARRDDRKSLPRSGWLGIAGILVLLVIGIFWARGHGGDARRNDATRASAVSALVGQAPAQISAPTSVRPSVKATQQLSNGSAALASASGGGQPATAGHTGGWRVIAYTYNRRADAEKKVLSIAESHPDLRPTVFTSSGHSPYLVSIGGVMDQRAAVALTRQSRSLGLPKDMYAQNYSH